MALLQSQAWLLLLPLLLASLDWSRYPTTMEQWQAAALARPRCRWWASAAAETRRRRMRRTTAADWTSWCRCTIQQAVLRCQCRRRVECSRRLEAAGRLQRPRARQRSSSVRLSPLCAPPSSPCRVCRRLSPSSRPWRCTALQTEWVHWRLSARSAPRVCGWRRHGQRRRAVTVGQPPLDSQCSSQRRTEAGADDENRYAHSRHNESRH